MEFESRLTNEDLKKDYESQFELVNHLIRQAQGMISSGRGPRVDTHSENIAVVVVDEEIRKDHISDVVLDEVSLNGIELDQEEVENA